MDWRVGQQDRFSFAGASVGSIAGTLRNEHGQPFPNVRVEIVSAAGAGQRYLDPSDVNRRYTLTELPPGTYGLRFTFMRRYEKNAMSGRGRTDCATKDKVVVRAGRRTTVDVVVRYCGDFTYETIRSGKESAR